MPGNAKCYLALVVVFAAGGPARSIDIDKIDPVWIEKAKTEGKAAYEKYRALSLRLEEESENRTDKAAGSSAGTTPFRPTTRRDRVIRLNNNVILEQIRILDGMADRPQIRLQCDNSAYHFTLGKSREDAPYALVEYALGERKIPLTRQEPGLYNVMIHFLRSALEAIENDDQWKLLGLQFDDAKGLLWIRFANRAADNPYEDQIYVDPTHGWRVIERRGEGSNAVVTDRFIYGVTVGGLEFPTEVKNLSTYKIAKAPPNMAITGRLISLKLTDKTPEDFRLTAFGLPEPVDAPPLEKPTRWYLWLLAAAGLCALLAFALAYLRRRRMAGRTSPAVLGASP